MNPFNRLPGHVASPPGLEHRIWRRLPAILFWGTALPLAVVLLGRLSTVPPDGMPAGSDPSRVWDYVWMGWVSLHWTAVCTIGLACFIVRVMKGPAYVADAYPLPDEREDDPADR